MSGSSNPTCPIIEEPDLRSSLVRTSTEDDEKDDTTTDQNVVLSSELKAYIDSCKEKGLEFMSRYYY
jgi:hypothetical protein